MKCGRITASKIYDVLHTDINNLSTSLIEYICKESTITNTNIPALKWGIDNEKNGLNQYTEFQRNQGHTNFKLNNCGLFLYRENSFLGPLTDGITQCSYHSEKKNVGSEMCFFSKRNIKY